MMLAVSRLALWHQVVLIEVLRHLLYNEPQRALLLISSSAVFFDGLTCFVCYVTQNFGYSCEVNVKVT